MADTIVANTPEAGTDETSGQGQPVDANVGGEDQFDRERAMETIHKQREAEKLLTKQVKDLQGKLSSFEEAERKQKEAELSDLQKAQAELEDLRQKYTEANELAQGLRLRQEFGKVAKTLNLAFISPQAEEDAFELADMAKVAIGEQITGLEEAVKALQKSRPYLFSENTGDGQGTPKRSNGVPKPPRLNQELPQRGPLVRF